MPEQEFLFFFLDNQNRSYYIDSNGGVAISTQPIPLQNKPIGWQDLEISFGTQDKYFSLIKALSIPLQYVFDGADILRHLLYRGRGYEEEVYCVILQWQQSGLHELAYKGRIDLSKVTDDPEIGVTVNAKEGGMQSYLDANDGVTYPITLDETNPDAKQVLFDGILLFDKLNYTVYAIDSIEGAFYAIGIAFISNEGDSVGVYMGSETLETMTSGGVGAYVATSNNYLFKSALAITIHIAGSLHFKNIGGTQTQYFIHIITPLQSIQIFTEVLPVDAERTVTINEQLTLAPEEPVFILVSGFGVNTQWFETKLSIGFTTTNPNSLAYSIAPLQLGQQLVDKMSGGKYTFASSWFTAHNNIRMTSGQALRNLPNAVLPITFADYFEAYNNLYSLCVIIIGNVLHIEKRDQFYSGNNIVYALGQISELKVSIDDEKIINTIKIGWPDQTYDERNGKYEFNSTDEFNAPVTVKKGELDLVGKSRGDCYGIEFIRGKLNNKNTTDNAGDNQAFMVNTEQKHITDTFTMARNDVDYYRFSLLITNHNDIYPLLQLNSFITITGSVYNSRQYRINDRSQITGDHFTVWLDESIDVVNETFTGTISFDLLILLRRVYDSITGVPTPNVIGSGAVYNVEEMTPKRMLLAWGSDLRSRLAQLPSDYITFQSSLKNKDLVTVLNGVRIAESDNVQVAALAAAFYLMYKGAFKLEVPLLFYKTFTNLQASTEIQAQYNGFTLYFLPIGKMSQKIATNDAQDWELLLSAKNNLDTLQKLSQEGLYISDGMNNDLYSSHYNPVQWVFYDYQLKPGIRYKDMFDDWTHHRNEQFADQRAYIQKWAKTDRIINQFVAQGLNQLELHIYNSDGRQIGFVLSTIIIHPAVRMPYSLQQFDLDLSTFAEGNYVFTISSNGVNLYISEWQNIADDQPETYLLDYYDTRNKLNIYFNNAGTVIFNPKIRVEADWDKALPDGSAIDYEDEVHSDKILHYEAFAYKYLQVGYGSLIPDWLAIKLFSILWTNRLLIEDKRMVRPAKSELEINQHDGVPFISFKVVMRNASGDLGTTVKADGSVINNPSAIYSLDAEAFGFAPGVIQAELNP